jgi:hypothetical protein
MYIEAEELKFCHCSVLMWQSLLLLGIFVHQVSVTGKNSISWGSLNVSVGIAHVAVVSIGPPQTPWHRLSSSQTYRVLKFVVGSFSQDSILQPWGSILWDLGVILLIIIGGAPDYVVAGGSDWLSTPLTCTFASNKLFFLAPLIL